MEVDGRLSIMIQISHLPVILHLEMSGLGYLSFTNTADAQITALKAVSLEGYQEYVGLCNRCDHYYII